MEENLRKCKFHHKAPGAYLANSVITPSVLNGALVLRHELGHSIIGVGEEYDGGFAYYGCNAAQEPAEIGWTHWLSNPPTTDQINSTARVERVAMSLQQYPWTILNSTYSANFSSTGNLAPLS